MPSILVVTGAHLKFTCGVQKTNHNDEPYIQPVIFFFFIDGIPFEPFVFLLRRNNSSAAPKCQPSEDEPPIIKPVIFFFTNGIRDDLFRYEHAT